MEELILGDKLEASAPLEHPDCRSYDGQFVVLRPLNPQEDAHTLYAVSHGDSETEKLWTYLPCGPFADCNAMQTWLEQLANDSDRIVFSIFSKAMQKLVGSLSYQAIEPDMYRLEIANVWFCPEAQRTNINTESIYLLLNAAFEEKRYRRVEWKCDALNLKSRNAALRLGFSYEGTFKQHMIVKGRNRDTAWFAMLDGDWPVLKTHMEKWLYGGEDCSLFALNQPQLRRPFF